MFFLFFDSAWLQTIPLQSSGKWSLIHREMIYKHFVVITHVLTFTGKGDTPKRYTCAHFILKYIYILDMHVYIYIITYRYMSTLFDLRKHEETISKTMKLIHILSHRTVSGIFSPWTCTKRAVCRLGDDGEKEWRGISGGQRYALPWHGNLIPPHTKKKVLFLFRKSQHLHPFSLQDWNVSVFNCYF